MDKHFGSFETGKKPGVVLIENLSDGQDLNTAISKRIL
jgi:hypothetical protein